MSPRGALVELALAGAWIVGLGAGLQVLEQLLGPANLGGAIFGALAVDLATGRVGVRWDWDEPAPVGDAAPPSSARAGMVRGAKGLALGLGLGALVAAICVAAGWAHLGPVAKPGLALAFAVARAAALAVRDELLFRGLPFAAASRAGIPPVWARAFGALAGGAAVLLVPGAGPAAVLLGVSSGLLFATLWERDGGAWMAVGAHTGWRLLVGSLLHGGLMDLDWHHGELAVGATASGGPAWLAIGTLAAAAVAIRRRTLRSARD